jgi:DNA helicase-2/ATP-dependent DNA helicase PcrA
VEGSVDEERRLLYVGVTRAMRQLTLTWCRARMKFGSATPRHPSSFIREFKEELLEVTDLEKIMNAPVKFGSAASRFAAIRAAIAR